MLDKPIVKQRIRAARILRGWSQKQLDRELASNGWGEQDGGRIERGTKDLAGPMIPALAAALGVPDAWFTEPDLDLTAGQADTTRQSITDLESRINAVELLVRGAVDQSRRERHNEARSIRDRIEELARTVQVIDAKAATTADRVDALARDVAKTTAALAGQLERAEATLRDNTTLMLEAVTRLDAVAPPLTLDELREFYELAQDDADQLSAVDKRVAASALTSKRTKQGAS